MRRLLILLYPTAWRVRYGAEMEALMEDSRAGRVDVLKGAMAMRMKYQPGWAILFGCALAGLLAGLGSSYLTPRVLNAPSRPDLLRLRFDYPDPQKALLAVQIAISTVELEPDTRFTVIDPPRMPTEPNSPNRRSMTLAGMIGGAVAGLAALLIRSRKSTPPGLQTA